MCGFFLFTTYLLVFTAVVKANRKASSKIISPFLLATSSGVERPLLFLGKIIGYKSSPLTQAQNFAVRRILKQINGAIRGLLHIPDAGIHVNTVNFCGLRSVYFHNDQRLGRKPAN